MIYEEKNIFTLAEMLLIAIQCSRFCIAVYMITYEAYIYSPNMWLCCMLIILWQTNLQYMMAAINFF